MTAPTEAVPIRVLVADDQTLVRAGFRSLLEHADDIEVVAEAADGREAVLAAAAHRPDVILMDIRMPELDGLGASRVILEDPALEETRIVILTTFDLDEYLFEALRLGASGFLLKDVEPDDLREAVRVAARGDALLAPSVTRRVIETFASRPALGPGRAESKHLEDPLTPREQEVVALVAAGLSNQEIADRLVVSHGTVKTHVSRALAKTGTRDRAQLVVFAYEHGLTREP